MRIRKRGSHSLHAFRYRLNLVRPIYLYDLSPYRTTLGRELSITPRSGICVFVGDVTKRSATSRAYRGVRISPKINEFRKPNQNVLFRGTVEEGAS